MRWVGPNGEGAVSRAHLFQTEVAGNFPEYLRDESRRSGRADSLSFVRSEDEIREVLASRCPVTTQGARTGITGGAVPDGGHILNLSRMSAVTGFRYEPARDEFVVTVQPGLSLGELRKYLGTGDFDRSLWSPESCAAWERYRGGPAYFFPPDPTETSASIGGMVACNASGALSFRYGPTRAYVEGLRVVLADGSVLALRRGSQKATGRVFSVRTESGRLVEGTLPDYVMPAGKNAAGLYCEDNMDLLDLFIGSEGTLGVFSEIELRLIRAPDCRWGVMVFLPSDESTTQFVEAVRMLPPPVRPVAIEYFDSHSLNLLRRQKALHASFAAVPELPVAFHSALYLEYHGDEGQVSEAVEAIPALIVAARGSGENTWIADTARELERFKQFRHAVPEAVNLVIDERRKTESELTKLGTDMAVQHTALAELLDMYRTDLAAAGLEYVIFGHIGNNHVHVNILPRSIQDYQRGKALYLDWARRIIALGGTVSAEHGIGKFKVALLREMVGDQGMVQMREVKRVFDPDGLLNVGNLF